MREIEWIEAHFDAFAGQMRRRFKETILQQESGIAAHQPVHAMKEQTPQIGGRRKLADLFDIALPAQQRRGLQRTVLMAVIDGVEPVPQALVELVDREQNLGIE